MEAIRAGYTAIFEAGQQAIPLETQREFIETIAPLAVESANKYGFNIVSPVIAQSCQETGYGTKMKGNAAFGWKASSGDSNTVKFTTHEGTAGKDRKKIVSNFAAYDDLRAAVDDHFKKLLNSSYQSYNMAKDASTPSEYMHCLMRTGKFDLKTGVEIAYSTDDKYVEAIMQIIKQHGLTKYDQQVKKHPVKATEHTVAVKDNPSWYSPFIRRNRKDVKKDKQKQATGQPSQQLAKFTATEDLNIRNKPSTKSGVEKRIPSGAIVVSDGKVIENEGRRWFKVKYQGEKYMFAGYCDSTYLKMASAAK